MNPSFTLPDAASLVDLRTYLGRAARVENGAVRFITTTGVVAVYTAILSPAGLLDQVPTVLGLRVFALANPSASRGTPTEQSTAAPSAVQSAAEQPAAQQPAAGPPVDAVLPIRAVLERLAFLAEPPVGTIQRDVNAPVVVDLPLLTETAPWAAVSPPRAGWAALPDLDAQELRDAARAGIAEVAEAVPASSGDAIVRRVRAEVWGRPIAPANDERPSVPAGAAFAAESLGFLGDGEQVRLFRAGPWHRLTTSRGHVLVRGARR